MSEYSNIILAREEGIAFLTLNRPKVLNALSGALLDELVRALEAFENDPDVRVIVLTGSEKAFAAGADIGNMAQATLVDMLERNELARGLRDMARQFDQTTKPVIAAVSGYALGGGCELQQRQEPRCPHGQPAGTAVGVRSGAGRCDSRGYRHSRVAQKRAA